MSLNIIVDVNSTNKFTNENLELIKNGELFNFSVYTIGSVLIGILAVFIGFYLTNR